MNDNFPKVTVYVDSRGRMKLFMDDNEFYYDVVEANANAGHAFTTITIEMPVSAVEIRTVD